MHPLILLIRTLILAGLLCWTCFLRADEFPAPYNSGDGADAHPLDALQAAEAFKVPPGFRVQLFAAEPDVQNPVAMTWDVRGRLWVAEYYTYAEWPLKFDYSLRDRVVILEDHDHDGQADERKVFCDNVQRLTSVEVGLGGVWVLSLPNLLFIPDRNGDDVADGPPQVVLDGFETSTENYHNCANGLRWGPDGWLYGRCGASARGYIGAPGSAAGQRVPIFGGLWRYHPTRHIFETLCHGTTNPWGHDWDEHGELFFTNTVTGHLFHLLPGAHYTRSSTVAPNRYVYENIDAHADHFHWDTGRGTDYRLTEHDQLGGGHAHCGAMIYLAEQWPAEYYGRLMTLNLHGRRTNVERLERAGNGFVARHDADICFAADQWYRGIDLFYGPDGSVYVLDWSDTGECHESDGVHRLSGRVFRISFGDATAICSSDLTTKTASELAELHSSGNEWFVRQARRELANRAAAGLDVQPAITALQQQFMQSQGSAAEKLRALWTLYTLGVVEYDVLETLLDHPDEHVRAWAIRLLTDLSPLDTVEGQQRIGVSIDLRLLSRLEALARHEPPGLARLALASTLQRLPLESRAAVATGLVSHAEDAEDHDLPKLVWYGLSALIETRAEELVPIAIDGNYPLTRKWITRALAEDPTEHAAALDQLLVAATAKSDLVKVDVVQGLADGLAGRRKVAAPPGWEAFVASLEGAPAELLEQARSISVVFGDGRALEDVRHTALDQRMPLGTRQDALETLIEARPDDLREICEQLLPVRFLNRTALQGLTLFDDPIIGQELARNYRSFHPTQRRAVIAALVSRPAFAAALLDEIAAGTIPVAEVGALEARQIRSFNDAGLSARLAEVWGELRDSPQDKAEMIDRLKELLSAPQSPLPDLKHGRALFQATCAKCHKLFGAGENIGPDLTGSDRHNLDYLLMNIVDPSAMVNKDYRMTSIQHLDGRVLNGVIVSQDEARIVLQTADEKMTILRDDIEALTPTTLSSMPDGILQPFTDEQVRDLMAYLMSPGQVELPAVLEASGGD